MPYTWGGKVDSGHAALREYAKRRGFVWVDTSELGNGKPDAFVLSWGNVWVALEIKTPGKKPNAKQLNFRDLLPRSAPYHVIEVPENLNPKKDGFAPFDELMEFYATPQREEFDC
jgi:hypothetical protein